MPSGSSTFEMFSRHSREPTSTNFGFTRHPLKELRGEIVSGVCDEDRTERSQGRCAVIGTTIEGVAVDLSKCDRLTRNIRSACPRELGTSAYVALVLRRTHDWDGDGLLTATLRKTGDQGT